MRARKATPSAMRFSQASGDVIDGQPAALLLELQSPLGKLARLLDREVDALGRDHGRDLLQALLAHGLGEDGIGFAEGIDPVDQVDVQLAHIHRKFADAIDKGGVGAFFAVLRRPRRFPSPSA